MVDPRGERRSRHPRDSKRRSELTGLFEQGVASGAVSLDDLFDTDYVEIAGTNPVQYRTKFLDWADRALPPFQEAFLAKDKRMAFCAMVDRNGYLPVHNTIYSQPQRPAMLPGTPPTAAIAASSTIPRGLRPARISAPI